MTKRKIFLKAVAGNSQKLDGGAMFGNAPRELWSRWTPPDEKNRVTLACRALLLRVDGRVVLFEAGIGAFFEPKLRERYGVIEPGHVLLENLARSGVKPEDVDAVVLSHLHFDHAGGVLSAHEDGEPRLVFPKAKFYVSRAHWSRAETPHPRDRASFIPVLNELLKKSGRLVLVEGANAPDLPPFVSFRYSDGHTPGLMMSQLHLASGPLVFVADLIPGMPWLNPAVSMGYDRYPELLIDEKTALVGDLADRNGKVFFTHDTQTPCAAVRRAPDGKISAEPTDVESLAVC